MKTLIKVALASAVLLPGTVTIVNHQADAATTSTTATTAAKTKQIQELNYEINTLQQKIIKLQKDINELTVKQNEVLSKVKEQERIKIYYMNRNFDEPFNRVDQIQNKQMIKINDKFTQQIIKINNYKFKNLLEKDRAIKSVTEDRNNEVKRLMDYVNKEKSQINKDRLSEIAHIREITNLYEKSIKKDFDEKKSPYIRELVQAKNKLIKLQAQKAQLSK